MQIPPAARRACSSRSARRRVCNVDFEGHADRSAGGRHQGVQPGPARARRSLHAVHVPPLPCGSRSTSRRSPIRGRGSATTSAARSRGSSRRGGEHEVVPFAPTSPQGRRSDPARRSPGCRSSRGCASCRSRTSGGRAGAALGRPPVERFLGAGRRPPLLRLDVSAAARRPPRDDGPRPRPAALPRVGAGPDEADARREVPQRRPYLRRHLRQLGVHEAARSSSCSASPRRRSSSRYPGVDERFRAEGERADLGRPYVLTVATLEPRKNLETLLAAHGCPTGTRSPSSAPRAGARSRRSTGRT